MRGPLSHLTDGELLGRLHTAPCDDTIREAAKRLVEALAERDKARAAVEACGRGSDE